MGDSTSPILNIETGSILRNSAECIEIVANTSRENVLVGLLGWLEEKLENVTAQI